MREVQTAQPTRTQNLTEGSLSLQIPRCVGKNIRNLRKERRMTQKDLAHAIGCEPSYISHIERVSRSISIRHLFQVANAMKITPATLVTDCSNELADCLEILQTLNPEGLTLAKRMLQEIAKDHPLKAD